VLMPAEFTRIRAAVNAYANRESPGRGEGRAGCSRVRRMPRGHARPAERVLAIVWPDVDLGDPPTATRSTVTRTGKWQRKVSGKNRVTGVSGMVLLTFPLEVSAPEGIRTLNRLVYSPRNTAVRTRPLSSYAPTDYINS
jgi:hypothetical protein